MEQSQDEYKSTILYGEKKLVFKTPVIIERQIKRRFWFGYRKEYWIEWEYCTSGPYNNYEFALEMHAMAMRAYQ